MKKLLLLTTFLLAGPFLSASHFMGGYFEHHIDTINDLWWVDLHVMADSSGSSLSLLTMTLNGPNAITLNRVGLPSAMIPFGSQGCVEGRYYEVVYSGSIDISTNSGSIWNNMLPKTYSSSFNCCASSTRNTTVSGTLYLEFSITPQVDSAGGPYFPFFDTRGLNPKMVQNAYPAVRNYNDFGLTSKPVGIDSVDFSLVRANNGPNFLTNYAPGYSGVHPLPDKTEDSLNGDMLFFPNQRVISAQARAGSYTPGRYLLNFVNDYYKQQSLYLSDYAVAVVYFNGQDPLKDSTYLQVQDAAQNYPAQTMSQGLNYTLDPGDSLLIDLKAFAGVGDVLRLIEVKERFDTTGLGANTQALLNFPQVSSLNANGQFVATDTNNIRLSFNPKQNNFISGVSRYVITLTFTNKLCEGSIADIRIRIDLSTESQVTVNHQNLDSVLYCNSQAINIQMLGSATTTTNYWSPGTWVVDSTAPQTSLQGNREGWLYLLESGGSRFDSVHFKLDSAVALNKPQFGPSNDIMVIDSGQSYQQRWTVSNFVKVKGSQEDLLPILGSGTYKLSTQYSQYGCESSSDTLGVADGFLWGSNYGPKGDEISQTIIDTAQAGGITYSCRLDMPSDSRFFEKIFFFGFENLNPQVPKEIRLKVLTSYGYQDSMVALIGQQGFVEFPVNFDLGPSLNAFLEIELDSGIVYHYFENNQTGFGRNVLVFSDLGYAVLGGPINYGRRIPIGFKYSGTVGLEAEGPLPIEVYPNPSTGAIILNWPHRQPGIVEAYDTRGKRVAKYNLKQGQQTISLDLASGIYSLVFPNHPQIESIKLVIQK